MLDVSSPIRVRRPFYYDGPIRRSKSWLNRALILRSIFSGLTIEGWHPSEADGEDVTHIGQALRDLAAGKREFSIGDSGTGFRFLLARLSRDRRVSYSRERATVFETAFGAVPRARSSGIEGSSGISDFGSTQ